MSEASIIGGVLSAVGSDMANQAEASAHRKNALLADKMAKYNKLVSEREEDVYLSEANKALAVQSMALGAGFKTDASTLAIQAESIRNTQQGVDDIRLKGRMTVEQLEAEADMSRQSSDALLDPTTRALSFSGSVLGSI